MLTKWEELQLIARCVAGDDRDAFGRLVEEYNDGLRRFLLNLTLGDAALTDDLAQDSKPRIGKRRKDRRRKVPVGIVGDGTRHSAAFLS